MAGEKEYWEKELGKISTHPDVREWKKKAVAWQRRAIRSWLGKRGYLGANLAEVEGVRKLLGGGKTAGWQVRGGGQVRSTTGDDYSAAECTDHHASECVDDGSIGVYEYCADCGVEFF
jgi:hypothetical protein